MHTDHPHMAFAAAETAALNPSPAERYIAQVEKLVGFLIDGHQITDGYSLDYAVEAFLAGTSAEDHAAAIRREIIARLELYGFDFSDQAAADWRESLSTATLQAFLEAEQSA